MVSQVVFFPLSSRVSSNPKSPNTQSYYTRFIPFFNGRRAALRELESEKNAAIIAKRAFFGIFTDILRKTSSAQRSLLQSDDFHFQQIRGV